MTKFTLKERIVWVPGVTQWRQSFSLKWAFYFLWKGKKPKSKWHSSTSSFSITFHGFFFLWTFIIHDEVLPSFWTPLNAGNGRQPQATYRPRARLNDLSQANARRAPIADQPVFFSRATQSNSLPPLRLLSVAMSTELSMNVVVKKPLLVQLWLFNQLLSIWT